MKNVYIILFLWVPVSCTISSKKPGDQIRRGNAPINADHEIHTAILNQYGSKQEIFGMWMHHLTQCRADSLSMIHLAHTNVDANRFWMFEFGMIRPIILGQENRREEICLKYNIQLYRTGCMVKYNCRIYNEQMERLIQQKKGLDYDSIIAEIYALNGLK